MYIEASRRRKGDNAKLELRSSLPTGKSCLSFFYNMHGGHNYMGTLRVLVNGETVFQKSGNQGSTWHKAEVTYRKGISSVRIQQEAKAYVYVAWAVAHDICTSGLMWQKNTIRLDQYNMQEKTTICQYQTKWPNKLDQWQKYTWIARNVCLLQS